jgi:hypothetical protein
MSDNPLDEIMRFYKVTNDSLRVTARVVNNAIGNVIREKHIFYNNSIPENEALAHSGGET